MFTIAFTLLFFSLNNYVSAKPAQEQKVNYQGKSYTLQFEYQGRGNCSYNAVKILASKKVVHTFDKLCGFPHPSGRLAEVIKVGATPETNFISLIHGSEQAKQTWIVHTYQGTFEFLTNIPDVVKFEDVNKDGYLDAVKPGAQGPAKADGTFTYDPYLVYVFIPQNGNKMAHFVQDNELSKKYSESKNYQWHGSANNFQIRMDKNGKRVR